MNIQKPEPRVKGDGQVLDFHSMFYTIQGEGPFAGHPAIFIRLAGCNLQCPGCDTEYTFGREARDINRICDAVVNIAIDFPCRLVVITGGEPLRQVIGPLVYKLSCLLKFKVQIESNGVFPPDPELEKMLCWHGGQVSLVVSPKTAKINKVAEAYASAFKYVLDHRSVSEEDGLPLLALSHPAKGGVARPELFKRPIYVNPFDAGDVEENKKNLAAVVASCMKHGYIAGVQMHKIMNLA